jgi:AcrR family transcriptional regulator
MTDQGTNVRRYDSPVRRRQAAETRARILEAACSLLRQSTVRDWRRLTIRAVAEKAAVHERTLYRLFVNERGLRDAVIGHLEEQAGIDLSNMSLEGVGDVARRILTQVSSYQIQPKPPLDPTLREASGRQHEALRKAVTAERPDWSEPEAEVAAAILDVLWSVASYERLVVEWQLDHAQATEAIAWAISLVQQGVLDGAAPMTARRKPAERAVSRRRG